MTWHWLISQWIAFIHWQNADATRLLRNRLVTCRQFVYANDCGRSLLLVRAA
jgi:hypothetical protein